MAPETFVLKVDVGDNGEACEEKVFRSVLLGIAVAGVAIAVYRSILMLLTQKMILIVAVLLTWTALAIKFHV